MTINLILGCMFSGKTSYIMNIAKMNKLIGKKVLIINFEGDQRYGLNTKMYTHDKTYIECVSCPKDILTINIDVLEYDVICINEGQFFSNLLDFCLKFCNKKEIYVCGLDGDYLKKPFGEILSLIPHCESYVKLTAICMGCKNGTLATFTKRVVNNENKVLIGSSESYIPVCRYCYDNYKV